MTIIERLQAEADQCRQDGANDIARLLDEAVEELRDHERAYALLFEECGKLRQRAEAAEADAARSERRAIVFADIVNHQVLAMRAAAVAARTEGASRGMEWILNTLCGPGHLPSDEDAAMGAQALFDKEMAEAEAFRAAHPAPAIDSQRKEQQT